MFDTNTEGGMFGSDAGIFEGGLADDDEITQILASIRARVYAVDTAADSEALTRARTRLAQMNQQALMRIGQGQGSATAQEFSQLRTAYDTGTRSYLESANTMFWDENGSGAQRAQPSQPTTSGGKAAPTHSSQYTSSKESQAIRGNTPAGGSLLPSLPGGSGGFFSNMRNVYLLLGVSAIGAGLYFYYKDKK